MRISIITSIVLCTVAFRAMGQQKPAGDSTLKGATTIEVIQSYKPEVKLAPKPEFVPDLPPKDTARPVFSYEVPQQGLNYTYHSLPLRPLALGKDSTGLPFPGYIKLGGGNLSTIYLDAGIGNLKGGNYETAIRLHHLSQSGSISNQKISRSGFEAEGTLHTNANAWHLTLEGLRNQYYYYGYNHKQISYEADDVKQIFTGGGASLDLKNEQANRYGIDYHAVIAASIYGDNYDNKERTLAFALPLAKNLDSSMQVQLGLNGNFTQLQEGSNTSGNNLLQITPGISYHNRGFSGHLGLYPTFAKLSKTYLLPDVQIRYRIPGSQFFLDGGWKGGVQQNTYRELSSYNPYMLVDNTTFQTHTDEIYAGFETNIGNNLTITGKISWLQYEGLPLFLNDTGDNKRFRVIYDQQVKAVSLQGSIRYQISSNFSIGVSGNVLNYYQSSYDRVWHEPGVRIKGDMKLQLTPALLITTYATILDQVYALNNLHQEVKLDPVTDLGLGVEYSLIPRLSAFLNVNNILNNKYERWYKYESYGLNIFGGLRLKF